MTPLGGAGLPPGFVFDTSVAQDNQDRGKAEPPTNPFFVGYSQVRYFPVCHFSFRLNGPFDREGVESPGTRALRSPL